MAFAAAEKIDILANIDHKLAFKNSHRIAVRVNFEHERKKRIDTSK
jgi:hypothetical protein